LRSRPVHALVSDQRAEMLGVDLLRRARHFAKATMRLR
jgi:hypothetical protein